MRFKRAFNSSKLKDFPISKGSLVSNPETTERRLDEDPQTLD